MSGFHGAYPMEGCRFGVQLYTRCHDSSKQPDMPPELSVMDHWKFVKSCWKKEPSIRPTARKALRDLEVFIAKSWRPHVQYDRQSRSSILCLFICFHFLSRLSETMIFYLLPERSSDQRCRLIKTHAVTSTTVIMIHILCHSTRLELWRFCWRPLAKSLSIYKTHMSHSGC